MRHVSPTRAAIAVGTVVSLWHAIWVILVGIGSARSVMDFILRLHFITLQYELEPYSAATAGALILLTFAVGAGFGLVFAVIWNWLTVDTTTTWTTASKGPSSSATVSTAD